MRQAQTGVLEPYRRTRGGLEVTSSKSFRDRILPAGNGLAVSMNPEGAPGLVRSSTSAGVDVALATYEDGELAQLFSAHAHELAQLAIESAEKLGTEVAAAMRLLAQALHGGHKVLACGNGGSAADAQHFVAEFIGRYMTERDGLPAISLTTDPSIITAVGNDYGFDVVFARQIEALGQPGDVLVALSTSGRSPNVLRAVEAAVGRGIGVIALTGSQGSSVLEQADVWCRVPSDMTPHIQEVHTALLHTICVGAEQLLGVGRS